MVEVGLRTRLRATIYHLVCCRIEDRHFYFLACLRFVSCFLFLLSLLFFCCFCFCCRCRCANVVFFVKSIFCSFVDAVVLLLLVGGLTDRLSAGRKLSEVRERRSAELFFFLLSRDIAECAKARVWRTIMEAHARAVGMPNGFCSYKTLGTYQEGRKADTCDHELFGRSVDVNSIC